MDTLRYPTLKSWATAVCDAVREKEESTDAIPHQDVPDRIHAIRTRPDEYPGPYTIEPAMEEQVLLTKDKVMTENLVVGPGGINNEMNLVTMCWEYARLEFDVSENITQEMLDNAQSVQLLLRTDSESSFPDYYLVLWLRFPELKINNVTANCEFCGYKETDSHYWITQNWYRAFPELDMVYNPSTKQIVIERGRYATEDITFVSGGRYTLTVRF